MNIFLLFIIFSFFSPIIKYEAKENFRFKFDKNYKALSFKFKEAEIIILNSKDKIEITGDLKIYHRNKEKANYFLKQVEIGYNELDNKLNFYLRYKKGKGGREAKKLEKGLVLKVYVPEDLPLEIFLKSGKILFEDKQERNILIKGKKLDIKGKFSLKFKKIEIYNYFGLLDIKGGDFIKRYIFPFGKKILYLNPSYEKEIFIKVIKGNVILNLGD